MSPESIPPRRRLPGSERRALLLDVARVLIREEGTDALTLGRVAERAGVAKRSCTGTSAIVPDCSQSCTASSTSGSTPCSMPPS
ncbi:MULTISPECIES: TetR family transcriptional regulator [unclassified Plantibacter]|uniref:TetR family transcriptional regulator n=1 Tax=unclassified Plantibacter TaxID=2624265 RepID=UPI0039C9B288